MVQVLYTNQHGKPVAHNPATLEHCEKEEEEEEEEEVLPQWRC